jgi:hypothetical protein
MLNSFIFNHANQQQWFVSNDHSAAVLTFPARNGLLVSHLVLREKQETSDDHHQSFKCCHRVCRNRFCRRNRSGHDLSPATLQIRRLPVLPAGVFIYWR